MSIGLVADNHLTLPVPLPDLTHLTQAELASLKGAIASRTKEARKDSVKALGKIPVVRDLWLKIVALPSTTSEEERAGITEPFHRECLRHPDAFLVYAYANALWTLDRHIWEEMLRRSKEAEAANPESTKRKR